MDKAEPVLVAGWMEVTGVAKIGVGKVVGVKFGAVNVPGVGNSLVLGGPNPVTGLPDILG